MARQVQKITNSMEKSYCRQLGSDRLGEQCKTCGFLGQDGSDAACAICSRIEEAWKDQSSAADSGGQSVMGLGHRLQQRQLQKPQQDPHGPYNVVYEALHHQALWLRSDAAESSRLAL